MAVEQNPGTVHVLAQGEQGGLLGESARCRATLRVSGRGEQPVAEAQPPLGVLDRAALLDEGVDGLGRAAVADASVVALVRRAQVAEVADAFSGRDGGGLGHGAGLLGDLEGKARGRGTAVGAHVEGSVGERGQQLGAQVVAHARLGRQGEDSAHLHPGSPLRAGVGHSLGGAVPPGQPERKPRRSDLGEVDDVARSVGDLAGLVHGRPSWWRVVAAGGGALDDEPVRARVVAARQIARQHVRGDDREKCGTGQRGRQPVHDRRRVERDAVVGAGAGDVDGQRHGLEPRQAGEQPRQMGRDARAHEHRVDAGKHGSEQGCGGPDLHLLQQVDADGAVMAFLRQRHLDVGAERRQPDGVRLLVQVELGDGAVRLTGRQAVRAEEALERRLGIRLVGVRRKDTADMAAGVAVLQHARDEQVGSDAGDDTEPTGLRHRARESPMGDGNTHTALDDFGERVCAAHDA